MEEHKVIVEQDSSGGYTCTGCGDPAVLLMGAGKWIHESENVLKVGTSARVEVKDFKPRSPQNYTDPNFIDVNTLYKNRREALYSATTLVSLDGYGSSDNALVTAELFERWLNRPEGEWWHPNDNEPTQLHVIKDEVQDLP